MLKDHKGKTVDQQTLEECIADRVGEGWDEDAARDYCQNILREGREYAEGEPDMVASDGLGILNREPTSLERCISARMDVEHEDLETATRTCSRMMNDPLYRHVFEEGDAWKEGEALWKWKYDHSLEEPYRSFREDDAREAKRRDDKINEIIAEIQRDRDDPDWILPASSLVDRATRIFEGREEARKVKAAREDRKARLTVGDLFGKSKAQILAGQVGDQRDFGKTRQQILAEVKADSEEREKLKKLRRREESE